ncbi:MAG: replicative DNA helicase, partial [Candidatus Euphemobacter frigidus]|nr:replicative DNA helicase [Candidatus Euphemobacter frigidus]
AQPRNLEAEMSVLGAMLLDQEAIPRVIHEINAESFFQNVHRKIFDAIVALYDTNTPVDPITLTDALKKRGELDAIGGPEYIITLMEYIPTTAHLDSHLKIVKEKSMLRDLIATSTGIVNRCYQETVDTAVVLDEVEKKFFELTQRGLKEQLIPMRQLIKEVMEKIEAREGSQAMVTGLATGLRDLDNLTCGLQPSELAVLAGRPSMGKTALALGIAEHASLKEKKRVGIFSLEMSSDALGRRMLCSNARVDAQNLRRGFLSTKDMVKLAHAAGRLSEAGMWIDDMPGATNLELRARARNMKARFDIDLLIVDYLQLMQATTGRSENRQQEVSDISRSLKALARELEIPILVVSQLNRGPEDRPDRRPRLSDLRESGAIEQDADLVILIMRPGAYPDLIEDDPDLENLAYVNVAKQRNGPTGEIKLTFIKRYTRFEDYAEIKE